MTSLSRVGVLLGDLGVFLGFAPTSSSTCVFLSSAGAVAEASGEASLSVVGSTSISVGSEVLILSIVIKLLPKFRQQVSPIGVGCVFNLTLEDRVTEEPCLMTSKRISK